MRVRVKTCTPLRRLTYFTECDRALIKNSPCWAVWYALDRRAAADGYSPALNPLWARAGAISVGHTFVRRELCASE